MCLVRHDTKNLKERVRARISPLADSEVRHVHYSGLLSNRKQVIENSVLGLGQILSCFLKLS